MSPEVGTGRVTEPSTESGALPDAPNRYSVREAPGEQGWDVSIVGPEGEVVWTRACAGEAEARSFASVVRQHLGWLSEEKFREYYRLPEAG